MATRAFEILNGPGKFDLMLCLFDDSGCANRRMVVLMLSGRNNQKFAINMLSREDGSGECWLFEGYHISPDGKHTPAKGFYCTKDRHGCVEF